MAGTIAHDRNDLAALRRDLSAEAADLRDAEERTAGSRLVDALHRVAAADVKLAGDISANRLPSLADVAQLVEATVALTPLCVSGLG
jgi:hypothetical protein